jgi:hypothetical protein
LPSSLIQACARVSSPSILGDGNHHYTTKGYVGEPAAGELARRPSGIAPVPWGRMAVNPVAPWLDTGAALWIRQGIGYAGPDGRLVEVIGHTHWPIEMLPGFV